MAGHVMAGKTLTIFLAADLKKFNSGLNDADRGLKGFAGNLNKMVGPALLATAAAAGALALKFAVDGVQAALEDEAALKKLATTLDNLGLSHDQPMVEQFIGTLERATGVADDELRPAYDRLVRSIGDTAVANDMLKLSMDISAGTGKSLQAVTEALGKAYDGNYTGLTRLGAGIDNAIIKTGDMDQITAALSATFKGQAATSAATFEGQVKRLSQAADNLKEAFGTGLLEGLGNTNNSTQNLVNIMEDAEEGIGDLARGVGLLIGDLADLVPLTNKNADASEDAKTDQNLLTNAVKLYATQLGILLPLIPMVTNTYIDQSNAVQKQTDLVDSLYDSTVALAKAQYYAANASNTSKKSLIASAYDSGIAHKVEAEYIERMTRLLGHAPGVIDETTDALDDLTTGTNGASNATKDLTKAEQKLLDQYDNRSESLTKTATRLSNEIQLLKDARTAVDDYAAGIANSLSTAISLGAAYQGQFDSDGKKTGQSWINAFDDQINLVTAFGNNLNLLKQSNVPDSLIQELASLGAPVGNAIVTDMLAGGEGLINTLSTKWVDVQSTIKMLAGQLVPEGLLAGEAMAAETVNGLITTLQTKTDSLNKLGKNMGKAVGVKFKAQILTDIAEAVREVEAIGTAARAEKVAQASREQVALTNAAVAQALQNLLRTNDARNGAPIAPVLS
jgi:hypothetical protein